MILCIAEKPMLGKAIADAIPGKCLDSNKTVLSKNWNGDVIKIVWCFGHMMEIMEPEDYDEKYKKWSLEDLPIFFPGWKKKVNPEKLDRVKEIGGLLKQASTVIHAGDLDDEGQSIVDELLEHFKYKGKVLRLNTVDVTPAALKKALDNMDSNDGYVQDGVAAYARQVCDAMFGFNLTRFYTLKNPNNGVIAIGRVQTPTLGLVVQRDMAIENYQKQTFYTLQAQLGIDKVQVWTKFTPDKDNSNLMDGYILDPAYLKQVQGILEGKKLSPVTVTESVSEEQPPLPFNTTKLNGYCGARWGMSPKDVLSTTQTLRDKYKAISYNRSECRYLSSSIFAEAPNTVPLAAQNLGLSPSLFDTTRKSKAFNDDKLTGPHTGIIPTAEKVDVSQFTQTERNVYEAITLYYLAQFMPPAKKKRTKLEYVVDGHGKLTATATEYLEPGYRTLLKGDALISDEKDEDEGEDAGGDLKSLKPGTYSADAMGFSVKEGQTKPPSYYTQTTLEEDMTRIARYCKNDKIKQLLLKKDADKTGENGSIGTSATRPDIINGLITHELIEEFSSGRKKYIRATEKGRQLFNALPDNVRGVDVTAKWWCFTEDIKAGKYTAEQMVENVEKTVEAVLNSGCGEIAGLAGGRGSVTGKCLGKCPKCGGEVYECKVGFRCVAPDCDFMLWKENKLFQKLGKTLTPSIVTKFLTKGKAELKGCVSAKTGSKYDAVLVADFTGERVQFSFEDRKGGGGSGKVIGQCPRCKKDFLDMGSRCQCTDKACGLTLWKGGKLFDTLKHPQLTDAEIQSVLTTGKVTFKAPPRGGAGGKGAKKQDVTLIADFNNGNSVRFSFEKK